MTDCLYIIADGICHRSVCVPNDWTNKMIERSAGGTGISSSWKVSGDKRFATGQPNPCPCEKESGRKHVLMVC